jgi:hypothetical protein
MEHINLDEWRALARRDSHRYGCKRNGLHTCNSDSFKCDLWTIKHLPTKVRRLWSTEVRVAR